MTEPFDPADPDSQVTRGADGLPLPGGPDEPLPPGPPGPPLPPGPPGPTEGKPSRLGIVGLITGIAGLLAAIVMAALLVTAEPTPTTTPTTTAPAPAYEADADGFIIEPPDSIGPDAFTVSVVNSDNQGCDKEKLIAELNADPDAKREWGRVMGIPEGEIEKFIKSLQSKILTEDTKVTNHGLHNGKAYSRQSLLPVGTAVLIGVPNPQGSWTVPPLAEAPGAPGTPTSTSASSTGTQAAVRCRCGNPLLGPYAPSSQPTPSISPSPSPSPTSSPRSRQSSRTPSRTPTPSRTASPSPSQT